MAKPKCTYDAHQSKPAKVWHFLAHEDSWQSFIVDAIIVILIGKYLLFPGLGLVLGTQFPVVAVVSGSMDHQGMQFGNWWGDHGAWYEKRNITKEQFQTFYKPNGFVKGDVFTIKESTGVPSLSSIKRISASFEYFIFINTTSFKVTFYIWEIHSKQYRQSFFIFINSPN